MTIKTQKDDASSIVSEELVEQIDEGYRTTVLKSRSEADGVMVVRSEGDESEPEGNDSPTVERGDYEDYSSPIKQAYRQGKMRQEMMPAAATSFADLERQQTQDEQLEAIVKTLCNGEMVICAILKDPTVADKPARIAQALRDQLERVENTLKGEDGMVQRAKGKKKTQVNMLDMVDDEDEDDEDDDDMETRSNHETEPVDTELVTAEVENNTEPGPDEPVQIGTYPLQGKGVTMKTQEVIEAGQELGEMIVAIANGPGERRSKYHRAQQAIEDFVYRSEAVINDATPDQSEADDPTEDPAPEPVERSQTSETDQRLNDLSGIVRSLAVSVEKLSDRVEALQKPQQPQTNQPQQPTQQPQPQQPVGRSLTNGNQPPNPLPREPMPQGVQSVNTNGKPLKLRSMIRKQYGLE